MNIALVAYSVPQSTHIAIKGMDSYIYSLGSQLRQLGHTVNLYARAPIAAAEDWIHPVKTPTFSWLAYSHFLKNHLKSLQADVYHSEYIAAGSAVVRANKRPCVVSVHDVIPFSDKKDGVRQKGFGNKLGAHFYFRWFKDISSADALILMSHHARQEALELTSVPEEKLHVVYNGVDTKALFPLPKKSSEKIKIGYLGGLDGRKNVRLLVDSFRELQKSHDNIELHIAGRGANLEVFRALNIPNAFFHGYLPEEKKNEFYNSLDIFVFPSLKEGFGNMALEAMAAGTPVVASNRTSLPEVVGDAGLVAEPTVPEMSEKISQLIGNPALRTTLAKKGRARAEEMNWAACARNTLKVYESVRK